MPKNPQRLELTWIGKGEEPQLEPRILVEDTEKSYGDPTSENMLIHGDNLLALKALEQDYAGKVKCIYIDPPYNTKSAFDHYDDGVEHSIWLNLISQRLKILNSLLSPDGSIWISIDDHECHYLKIVCDEIFGRTNFISTVIWENFYGRSNAAAISPAHNYKLVYSPMGKDWKKIRNLLPRDAKNLKNYSNPDNDPRGFWRLGPIFASGERHEGLMYEITTPSGRKVSPPKGSHWRMKEDDFWRMVEEGSISFGEDGGNIPATKLYLSELQSGLVARSIWTHKDVGHSQEAKREMSAVLPEKTVFDTPKPERLLYRIITMASNPGDLILDSFLGSGTTAAVAHKMGRRWIGIELGQHANTHCLPRLKKVVDGFDEGGITKSVDWKGGGGFKFYNLAPSLLRQDDFGNWIIDERYNADMLAAAMAKQEGYRYAPNETRFWKQAKSTENDYLFTTTQLVTVELVERIAEQMEEDESLLICCKSFQKEAGKRDPRIDVKKIPSTLLGRCEFGKDDYSLNIVNVPTEEASATFEPAAQKAEREAREEKKRKYGEQARMFKPS